MSGDEERVLHVEAVLSNTDVLTSVTEVDLTDQCTCLTSLLLLFFLVFQTLPDLKADNQRLKDENGALIRVISKLSK